MSTVYCVLSTQYRRRSNTKARDVKKALAPRNPWLPPGAIVSCENNAVSDSRPSIPNPLRNNLPLPFDVIPNHEAI